MILDENKNRLASQRAEPPRQAGPLEKRVRGDARRRAGLAEVRRQLVSSDLLGYARAAQQTERGVAQPEGEDKRRRGHC